MSVQRPDPLSLISQRSTGTARLWCYGSATQCLLLRGDMILRVYYAMAGTETGYRASRVWRGGGATACAPRARGDLLPDVRY
eukprot:2878847-Rhodomonas_salina.2